MRTKAWRIARHANANMVKAKTPSPVYTLHSYTASIVMVTPMMTVDLRSPSHLLRINLNPLPYRTLQDLKNQIILEIIVNWATTHRNWATTSGPVSMLSSV